MSKSQTISPRIGTGVNLALGPWFLTGAFCLTQTTQSTCDE